MKNIELKISIKDFDEINSLLKKTKAKHIGEMHQIDTYYCCENNRLKIRNINNKEYVLISYKRPDKINDKISNYEMFSINPEEINSVQSSMERRFEQLVVVEKNRDLWIWKDTRIHLDTVSRLGNFLEIETIIGDRDLKSAKEEFNNIFKLLGLKNYKKFSNSYSDLLSEKLKTNSGKAVKFDQSVLIELFTRASKPA